MHIFLVFIWHKTLHLILFFLHEHIFEWQVPFPLRLLLQLHACGGCERAFCGCELAFGGCELAFDGCELAFDCFEVGCRFASGGFGGCRFASGRCGGCRLASGGFGGCRLARDVFG